MRQSEAGAPPRLPAPGIAVPAMVAVAILVLVLLSAAWNPPSPGLRGKTFPFPDCMKSCR